VGVQGAGMEWLYFLPQVSGIIEVGWHRWPAGMYNQRARKRGLKAETITAHNLHIDWSAYSRRNNLNNLTQQQKSEILHNNVTWWLNSNPYKFADGHVDVKQFLEKLNVIKMHINKKGVTF
jgi:hypothetical protein